MEGSDLKRYFSQTSFGGFGSNEGAQESRYYFERPMMLNAWTQTDDIFIHNNKQANSNNKTAREEKLLQKIAALEKELKMHRDFLDRMITNGIKNIPQQEQSTIVSIATTGTTDEPKAKRMKTSSKEQQHQHTQQYYNYGADIKSSPANSSSCSSSTPTQPSVINAAVPVPTDSIKYTIIGDAGVNGNEEPIEIQLAEAEDDNALNLNSSAESGRLEICLSEDGPDIKTEQQQQQQEQTQHSNKTQVYDLTGEHDEQEQVHTGQTNDQQREREQEDAVQNYLIKRGNILFPITSTTTATTTTSSSTGSVMHFMHPSDTQTATASYSHDKTLDRSTFSNCSSQLASLNGAMVFTTHGGGCAINSDRPILYNQVNLLKQPQQQHHPFMTHIQQQQAEQQQHDQNVCHIVTNDRVDLMQLASLSSTATPANYVSQQYQYQQQSPTSTTVTAIAAVPPSLDNNQQQPPQTFTQLSSLRPKQTNQCTSSTTKTVTTSTKKFDTTTDNVLVSLGPNNTRIPAHIYENISWNSASMATRKLLMAAFDRETLATHSMTGKPSPAFKNLNKPAKEMLDPLIIADIIFAVTHKCNVSEKEVRNAITTKCADENKMMKQQVMKKRRSYEIDNNKENKESIDNLH